MFHASLPPVHGDYTILFLSLNVNANTLDIFYLCTFKTRDFFFLIRKKTPASTYTPYATVLGIGHWL